MYINIISIYIYVGFMSIYSYIVDYMKWYMCLLDDFVKAQGFSELFRCRPLQFEIPYRVVGYCMICITLRCVLIYRAR